MSSMRKYKGFMTEFEGQLRTAKYVSVGGRTKISSEYIYDLDNIINCGNYEKLDGVADLF